LTQSTSNQSDVVVRTPPAEVAIDATLVRALLEQQHPDLAPLILVAAESGFDNALYRLGPHLAVRLPRRELGARFIVHEQRWLPLLAERLPLPIPAPVRSGEPGCGYPWRWSVVPWLHGVTADVSRPAADQASVLAGFMQALHVSAPADAPRNEYRGVPLQQRATATEARIRHFEDLQGPLAPGLRRIWDHALATGQSTVSTWLHGDLHPRNVLCQDGRLSGILDWGDLCTGDRATDLAAIWVLLDEPAARAQAMSCYGADEESWTRARGWALAISVLLAGMLEPGEAHYRAIAANTMRNLLAGPF
jgi:aminoglycoside phosphotransferase (APT) family kinase protein